MATKTKRRVTIKFKSPNPLFEEWLTNWRQEAIEKNSKLRYTFKIALDSLKKYPLPLESGQQCLILKGFGKKLCQMLDNKLKEYRNSLENNTSSDLASITIKSPEKPMEVYKPLSVTLPKSETITKAAIDSTSCTSNKDYLTINEKSQNQLVPPSSSQSIQRYNSKSNPINTATDTSEQCIINGGTFDIILYVDKCETFNTRDKKDIITNLSKYPIKVEVKDLKVGDFTWICRERYGNGKVELVLPYIIERKRMDDFAHSIKDKRYHEQKFRLKKSGIENLIYLVENYSNHKNFGLPLETLNQAACNTAIQDKFFVKFTDSDKDTVDYLVNMTNILIKTFQSKKLISCTKENLIPVDVHSDSVYLMAFKDFNDSSIKNKKKKISDLFVTMLLQIKGMSVPRALAIIELYPTPTALLHAYEQSSCAETLLADITYDQSGKKIGAILSKIIYLLFIKDQY